MKFRSFIRKLGIPTALLVLSLGMLAFRSQPRATGVPAWVETARSMDQSPASGLSPEQNAALLVNAIIQVESGGDPAKVGSLGERGLMQIRAGTWRDMTKRMFGSPRPFDEAFDPELNRRVGTAYLAWLQKQIQARRKNWHADERSLLLAAYNAGPTRLKQSGFRLSHMPRQTQDYVERAGALHDQATGDRGLMLAASVLPTPGS